ncbi:MAG: Eco57I restriction-modification methylase domain-containing protein [Candidatus Xenobia bacterium]
MLAAEAPYQDVLHLVSRLLFLLRAEAEDVLPKDAALSVLGWRKRAVARRRASAYDVGAEVREVLRACSVEAPVRVSSEGLLSAIYSLCYVLRDGVAAPVDAETVGEMFTELLAFHALDDGTLQTSLGNARKRSGSYYTPDCLIQCLLDSALMPDTQTVCDPSCGSGQFLLAAARRMAGGDLEKLREIVVERIAGVDLNPLAVELCRFNLWLEMRQVGVPLPLIRCGDSLLGTTPELLAKGLPEAAFQPLLGDDAALCRRWRARCGSPGPHAMDRRAADLWCAAFVWPRQKGFPEPPTQAQLDGQPLSAEQQAMLAHLQATYRFLHWPWDFPRRFDVVLGNPPWERVELQDREWFASRAPEIYNAPNAAVRKRMIAALADQEAGAYQEARRRSQAELHFLRASGRYPRSGRGGINRYAPFLETCCRDLVSPHGRVGYVVPSGLCTDEQPRALFRDLMDRGTLLSLHHFDNRKKLFPGVGSMITFALVTVAGTPQKAASEFVCFAQKPEDLRDPRRRFSLSAADLRLMNPKTGTLPIFRSARDADITRAIYQRVPVLRAAWDLDMAMLFQMSGDSHLFRTAQELERDGYRLCGNVFERKTDRYLPLYEAKMMHQYDHRWAGYVDGKVRSGSCMPRYWVQEAEVERRVSLRSERRWLLAWRDVCRSTDERSAIACALPRVGVGHTAQILYPQQSPHLLLAVFNSLVFDYVARQKIGGIHLTYSYLNQLPALPLDVLQPHAEEITRAVLELTYTSPELAPFAQELGYRKAPFVWDDERRHELRCRLDALCFRLYGLSRVEVEHVLSTFPLLASKERRRYGEFRTRRRILELL